jgi:anhydro-N-acetylmuramic acid kinase
MSGTSFDAIDVVAADFRYRPPVQEGVVECSPLGHLSWGYPESLRRDIAAALAPVTHAPPGAAAGVEGWCRLDNEIGKSFASAAAEANTVLCEGSADLVVLSGQTLYHWVEDGLVRGTLQAGQPAWTAEATGLTVVSDLRARDVACGGQGAPLVSLFDSLLLGPADRPQGALNLGGIANITVVAPGGQPVAYDLGPANALIDSVARHSSAGRLAMDRDGAMARRGRVDEVLLRALLDDPFFSAPAPKSTGKEKFHLGYVMKALERAGLGGDRLPGPEDLAATVTTMVAQLVGDACHRHALAELVLSGGGTSNPTLMDEIARFTRGTRLRLADELGIPSPAKEACAFGLLGFLTLHGVGGTIPSCTGARAAAVLGSITPGAAGLKLPAGTYPYPQRLVVH